MLGVHQEHHGTSNCTQGRKKSCNERARNTADKDSRIHDSQSVTLTVHGVTEQIAESIELFEVCGMTDSVLEETSTLGNLVRRPITPNSTTHWLSGLPSGRGEQTRTVTSSPT